MTSERTTLTKQHQCKTRATQERTSLSLKKMYFQDILNFIGTALNGQLQLQFNNCANHNR